MEKQKVKKPIYKKWWFWVIIVLVLPIFLGAIQLIIGTDVIEAPVPVVESPAESEEVNEASIPVETQSVEDLVEPEPSTEAEEPALAFDSALGKDIDDLTWYGPSPVNNDVTGKWYLARVNGTGDMVDYALSYYTKYFGADDEVHFLVNFATGTTTRLNYTAGLLFVSTFEHEDGEENDAKVMPSGMPLGSYIVDVSTGEIEDVTNAN